MKRHLLLVGLPGSGKSTVGRLVAEILEIRSYDIDAILEENNSCTVAELILNRGESKFRELEKHETEKVLNSSPAVVIPGGGWAAEGSNLTDLRGRALTVYLEVDPATATERLGSTASRPLVDGPDPLSRMSQLLELREPFYKRCDTTVFTDGKTVNDVVLEVVELARGAE